MSRNKSNGCADDREHVERSYGAQKQNNVGGNGSRN